MPENKGSLMAGVATREITPAKGVALAGYPHYERENTGVHDPLCAACLYLNNGREEVAFVTMDLLFFSKRHVQEVRRRVQARCGMEGKSIMLSCSHTHSGPWASGRLDIESLEAGREQPKEYVEELIAKLTELIVEARENSFAAEFSSATALCGAESGVGGNRRYPGGPCDPLVSVLSVREPAGAVRGIFVNYSLHPTFIHEWSTVCTADYPGYLRKQLHELEPEAVIGFAQGASGNQSSRYYRRGESYDEAERVGRALGRAAHEALRGADWKRELELRLASAELPLELRDPGNEEELLAQLAVDREAYDRLYAKYGKSDKREEYYLWQNANLKLLGTEDRLGYVRMRKKGTKIELLEDENPAELQVVRLGDTCVIGAPGEIFVEYALYLKAMSGFRMTVFNELSNGCLPGYLYTPEALTGGGYETDTSMIGEEFGRHLVDRVLDLIQEIR